MRLFTIVLFLIGVATGLKAQTFNESFRQKRTQNKYLSQQIAALQVYIDYSRKGYSIVSDGLDAIEDFKGSDFSLHTAYFSSLKKVNPTIGRFWKVADIIALQEDIVRGTRQNLRWIQQNDEFNIREQAYIKGAFVRLLKDSKAVLSELIALITDDALEMKDDERLERINRLHQNMVDNTIFFQGFSNRTKLLAASRTKETRNVQMQRILQDIKEDR